MVNVAVVWGDVNIIGSTGSITTQFIPSLAETISVKGKGENAGSGGNLFFLWMHRSGCKTVMCVFNKLTALIKIKCNWHNIRLWQYDDCFFKRDIYICNVNTIWIPYHTVMLQIPDTSKCNLALECTALGCPLGYSTFKYNLCQIFYPRKIYNWYHKFHVSWPYSGEHRIEQLQL